MKGSRPFSFLSTDSTNNLIQCNTYTVVPQKTPSDPIIILKEQHYRYPYKSRIVKPINTETEGAVNVSAVDHIKQVELREM